MERSINMEEKIVWIINEMADYLNVSQMKKLQGCSDRTIQYYSSTLERMFQNIKKTIRKITTEEIRKYLVDYQKINNCGKVTVDNIRRNISSFFSWLEEEDYILKSPMKRIHVICICVRSICSQRSTIWENSKSRVAYYT